MQYQNGNTQNKNGAAIDDAPEVQERDLQMVYGGGTSLAEIIQTAQETARQMIKLRRIAVSLTTKDDWKDMGGKPYLETKGALPVGRLLRVSIHNAKCAKDFYDDPLAGTVLEYTWTGEAYLPNGDVVPCIGMCDTKDSMFMEKGGKYKELAEIDRKDVKRAAHTRLLGNGIKSILGLRNLTWPEVNEGLALRDDYKSDDPFDRINFNNDESRQERQQAAASGNLNPEQMIQEMVEMIANMADTQAGRAKLSRELLGFEKTDTKEWVNGPNDPKALKKWKNYPACVEPRYKKVLERFNQVTDQELADEQN